VNRRAFLGGLAAASVGTLASPSLLLGRTRAQQAPDIRIQPGILRQRLEELSVFGRPEGGAFADGVSRVAYSDADLGGRRYVMDLMRAAGLEPRVDPAGNIFGRRAGQDASLPPIVFGSHIDSVPSGGNFDGDLGILASLGALEALDRAGLRTSHPLEMVIFSAEEGVAFGRGLAGSRIVAGDIKPEDLTQVWNGFSRAEGIRRLGGNPDRIMEAARPKGAHRAYFELHIEQGGTLEASTIAVGVVQGIVSIQRHRVEVSGFANHAGTTPMPIRQDAMLAISHLTIAVREIVMAMPGRQVGTVGHVEVSPNAPNVIPGKVVATIELRDLSPEKLVTLADQIKARAARIAAATKTTIDITSLGGNPPALADTTMQDIVERSADTLGLSAVRMPSGAGHDAQMMAQISPMGMIFVPSIGGISHSPRELTRWDDCANGANVLLQAVLAADGA
jgi:N-carbamoyl-L-amino-acid hydrolase